MEIRSQKNSSKAIKESQVALVVFSKNYATSRWCLNELMENMERKDENGQTVIPVFYDVDPSDVRNQRESFAESFAKHESNYKDDVDGVQKVQGWRAALTAAANLKGYDIRDGIESENIQQIVDHISFKLCKSAYSLSSLQNVVGINAHLEKLKSRLQIEVNDVRIVGIWGIGGVAVTTRNRHLIDKDDAIYEELVYHSKGLPLALKVWGSLLHKRGIYEWKRTVDKIKKNSSLEILENLKISYDGLEPEEQKIFLDLACFFRGVERNGVLQILESCDFRVKYGLEVLIDKSLVFISESDKVEMHDLIQEMGIYVVKMQKESGEPSKLWDIRDFEEVMVDNTEKAQICHQTLRKGLKKPYPILKNQVLE
ncbi:hypothetical protein KY285_020718 [Solanum tuberosum]|nr:hypothetical protein KY285_020718 [Solanum tuberosum]